MMTRIKTQIRSTGLALLASTAMAHVAIAEDAAPFVEQAPTIASVTVAYVSSADMLGQVSVSGTLVPREEILIFPQVSGSTINVLSVDMGDFVNAGDVLATLDDITLRAQFAQSQAEFARAEAAVSQSQSQITSAEANAIQAASALQRAQTLRESGTGTQATLDQAIAANQTASSAVVSANSGLRVAEAQLQTAQAQLDIAALNLDRSTLRAPFDGLISARNGQLGAIASSGGEPIFRLIRDGLIEIEAEVIETALGQIVVGDKAQVNIAGVGIAEGIVRRISPTVDPRNRLGKIRIEISEVPGLRSGLFASGYITTEERNSLTVPTTAVLTDADGTYVLAMQNNILEKRYVIAGLIWEGRREVLDGLDLNEVVVARAGAFFGNGDEINPIFPDNNTAKGE